MHLHRNPRQNFTRRPLHHALATALLGLALNTGAVAQTAHPSALDTTHTYQLPAGTLGRTLATFAIQSGLALSFDPALTEGLNSPGLNGSYTPRQALERLLHGTGLAAEMRGDGSYTLYKLPAASGNATLAPVTVRANTEQESAWGPVPGYVATRSATGAKTDTPIIETPQSISVVGAKEIETRKADSLMDAMGYTAGAARWEAQDRTADTFILRGFQMDPQSGSFYRDGTKYTVNPYNGRQEPYGLERIEVLKGAASVLYGTAAPGGIINTVSKRPTLESVHELNVSVGSFNRKQVSGDFGGALTEDGVWSYRLTGLHRDSNSAVDHVPDDRTFIAPALKWQPTAATSLTLLSEYQRDRTAYTYGLPATGTVLPNPNGRIPRGRFVGEPDYDKFDLTRYSIGYLFEHAFNDQLQLRHSLRYFNAENTYDSIWTWGLDTDQRATLFRGAQDREDRSAAVVADTSLQYNWTTGGIAHTSLIGFDITRQRHETERYNRTAQALDLYTPVYGGALGEPELASFSSRTRTKQIGLYAQDQMKIADKWVALLGGRHDWTRYDERAFFTDDVTADNEKSSAFTGRAGLVYLADNGLAPYASYSQSFEPQSGTDRNGSSFEPTRGEQWELGLRYQPKGSDTMLSAAVYDLTRANVLVSDPLDSNASIQHGEVRSRGVELEARTRIGRHANLIAAYAYTDAKTTKSSPLTPEEEGKRSGGVPYNQFSLWGDYSFGAFGLPGLKAGAGVRYVDATRGIWVDAKVPAFTLFDAMVSYSTGPWRFALNATNLTDKTYVASCTYDCFYGEPRKVIASVGYRW
ncbi:MAG: TonB-dependent siderophore receptor [Rhodocyclaceae bacterium]